MSQTILNQMMKNLQLLEPAELQQLNEAVQALLNPEQTVTEQTAFHQAMLNAGLLRRIKTPSPQLLVRQRIQVKGEPISETVLKERR